MVRFRLHALLPLLVSLLLVACGQDSNTYTPDEDTISITSAISFPSATRLTIVDAREAAMSTKIRPCEISFGDEETLDFQLVSDSELIINDQTFTFARALAVSVDAPSGVDQRLFAVWTLPSRTISEVKQTVEVEIQADKIFYRNTCSI